MNVRHFIRPVDLNLRSDFRLEVAVASEECQKRCLRLLDVDWRVRFLLNVICNLHQAAVCESFGARKLIHPEINGRLQNEDDPDSFLFGSQVELNVGELAGALKSG